MFEVAENYDRDIGHWSKHLARLFVQFVGVGQVDRVLDVGCGTGSLAWELTSMTAASKIVGIDPSAGFPEYAASRYSDPRLTFEAGDAQCLVYPNASFDRCLWDAASAVDPQGKLPLENESYGSPDELHALWK